MSPKGHKHNHKHHHHGKHGHHHHQGHHLGSESEEFHINSNILDSVRSQLVQNALPILLGKDGDTNDWKLESGKDLENGIIYRGDMPGFGTVWKVEFVLDCSAETMFASVAEDLDISWITTVSESDILERNDDYCVLRQRIHGVFGVSDRDFVFVQFPGQIQAKKESSQVTTYYSLTQSIPEGLVDPVAGCVRGAYLPSGWAWTSFEEQGKVRCHSTLIYNLDLKGLLPKTIVQLAASTFLARHVKAAQEHATKLASGDGQYIVPPSVKPAPTKTKKKNKKSHH